MMMPYKLHSSEWGCGYPPNYSGKEVNNEKFYLWLCHALKFLNHVTILVFGPPKTGKTQFIYSLKMFLDEDTCGVSDQLTFVELSHSQDLDFNNYCDDIFDYIVVVLDGTVTRNELLEFQEVFEILQRVSCNYCFISTKGDIISRTLEEQRALIHQYLEPSVLNLFGVIPITKCISSRNTPAASNSNFVPFQFLIKALIFQRFLVIREVAKIYYLPLELFYLVMQLPVM